MSSLKSDIFTNTFFQTSAILLNVRILITWNQINNEGYTYWTFDQDDRISHFGDRACIGDIFLLNKTVQILVHCNEIHIKILALTFLHNAPERYSFNNLNELNYYENWNIEVYFQLIQTTLLKSSYRFGKISINTNII